MKYKAFEDWYHEAEIKHLLLLVHNENLLSPPFATEKCKSYSTVWSLYTDNLDLELPPVTSKTNAFVDINRTLWLVPYGIYDHLNTVVEITDNLPKYHTIPFSGKGQFYSIASNGKTAFSFPLGYEGTNHGIYIDEKVTTHSLPYNGVKLHMGTVYCNGRYWSMPRGDQPGYNKLLSFDGDNFQSYTINVDNNISRKYSDIIVKGNTLYSLPYGETPGLNEVVEFHTDTLETSYHTIDIPDFAKKFNGGVLLDDVIVGVPYGDEHANDSNWGIMFNTEYKTSKCFDIGIGHGGKYRYRCGIKYKNSAYFFPSGTPSCPLIKVDKNGIVQKRYFENLMLGRPIEYQKSLAVIAYNIETKEHNVLLINEELDHEVLCSVA